MQFSPVHPSVRGRRRLIFLVWHDIVAEKKQVWFDTTLPEFEAQLATLWQVGARPVSLNDAFSYLRTGHPTLPGGSVVLCFDDNTRGIYDFAFPRLRAQKWPFVVCAHTKYVGVTTGKAHNTWEQLREMEKDGSAVLVSQTHTHPPDLRALNDAALRREMVVSKGMMEISLDHTVPFLTYPSGKWNPRVAEAARQAGYQLALTEDHGVAESSPHLLGIHRYSTHRRFPEALRAISASSP